MFRLLSRSASHHAIVADVCPQSKEHELGSLSVVQEFVNSLRDRYSKK
jgi:hypothetical protein